MRRVLVAFSLALTGASAPGVGPTLPVAVELFTSQGCSSCPPADAFAEDLSKREDIVVLTRPVTYWDRLGWRDTLARSENTRLQQAYADRTGDPEGVYTPQMVIGGRFSAVGSDRRQVMALASKARRASGAAIAVRQGAIGIAGKGGPAEVRLIGLRSSVTVKIGKGENGGRTVRYTNVVVSETVVGQWNGKPTRFAIPNSLPPDADRRAIILQQPNGGPILAARYL